ncbi:hypothetical protein QAD02_006383 [Eretmocerus hayati]|uniref:Uncharacterized protein n=1 Tax=Eretmocerus hayati TaxID=131215 RepID=A0ACC2N1V7_9HYME|nr:hypothetical protein QAD02_006383 [Eretmocerus hayati]
MERNTLLSGPAPRHHSPALIGFWILELVTQTLILLINFTKQSHIRKALSVLCFTGIFLRLVVGLFAPGIVGRASQKNNEASQDDKNSDEDKESNDICFRSVMELERMLIILTLMEERDLISPPSLMTRETPKSHTESKAARDRGNALFRSKVHDESVHVQIFKYYSKSIAVALNQSEELALGYGNRSAFLLHIKRYEDSILDIDRALAITKSEHLKIKLLCRKVQGLKELGKYKDSKLLKEAQELLENMDDKDAQKKSMSQIVSQAADLRSADLADWSMIYSDLFGIFHISIRSLIKGIKEAGSIEKLRSNLKNVDQTDDPRLKGFFQDGKFSGNTFSSIYSLSGTMAHEPTLKAMALNACRALFLIAKHTSMLGEDQKLKDVQDLMYNDLAVFVGSLILKLMQIILFNYHEYCALDYPDHESYPAPENFDPSIGWGICSWGSLFNHSCWPNARRFFVCGQRIVILCVLPIKKNDQIFDTYSNDNFYEDDKTSRTEFVSNYQFDCSCQACCENWPPVLEIAQRKGNFRAKLPSDKACYRLCSKIEVALREKKFKFDPKTVKYLSEYISKASKEEKVPSAVICYAISNLREIFRANYSFRRLSFGSCE